MYNSTLAIKNVIGEGFNYQNNIGNNIGKRIMFID